MAYRKGFDILSFTPSFLPFVLLFRGVLLLVKIIDWFFIRIRIKGRENLERLERALLISNHTLLLDPGLIAHTIRPRRTYFTMLEETALIPILGTFVRLLGALPIPETPSSISLLESAVQRALGTLGLVHFFPEGECYQWSQEIHPFRIGAFFLACRLRLPVLPLTIVLHERRLFGKHPAPSSGRRLRLPLRVTIVVEKPLDPEAFLSPGAEAHRLEGKNLLYDESKITHQGGRNDGLKTLKRAALTMSQEARERMQSTINREKGCKTIYKGQMPRLAGTAHTRRRTPN